MSQPVVQAWRGIAAEDADEITRGLASLLRRRGRRLLADMLRPHRVLVAWNAGFTATGATVVLTPHAHQEVIEPGVSLSEHFIASGTHVRPQRCTLNGVPCS